MPDQRQQQRGNARAVVRAQEGGQEANGQQRALVAVTREIDSRLAIVEASGAAGIRADRLKLVALTAFTRTPALWTCDPVSIARAIVEAGQLGLEPTGLLGGAYLVPRGGQATLLVGYRGLVILAMRSGLVQRVEAHIVREKDAFAYRYGLDPDLDHVPSTDPDPGPYTGAYAVIFYRDGSKQFDYMSAAEIEAIRKRSSSPNAGPWVTDAAEMWKKTPLRRLMKLAPLTVEVAAKLDELDPEVEEPSPRSAAGSRQAELRHQLQAALAHDQGQEEPVEGQVREVPTTHGAESPRSAQGDGSPEGAREAPSGDPAQAATPAAVASPSEASPAAAGEQPTCGVISEALGAGPCVLAAGHAQGEHEEAGGTRFTIPRGAR